MPDPLKYVNELIDGNQELFYMATAVMKEYEDVIEDRMRATTKSAIKHLDPKTVSRMSMHETMELAEALTVARLKEQVDIFYIEEIERLMDAYNDGSYDSLEFNIRCGIITQYKHTINYEGES